MESGGAALGQFFQYCPVAFTPTGRGKAKNITLVEMDDGLDFIMRPVREGMCLYESLLNGTIGMEDLARMNDTLDVYAENEARLNQD